jgi:hypothetical protein
MEFARSTPDIEEIMPPSARLRLEGTVQSGRTDHMADVQPHSTANNAMNELAEMLAAICVKDLESAVNSINGMDVDIDINALAEELQVSDLLQGFMLELTYSGEDDNYQCRIYQSRPGKGLGTAIPSIARTRY